MPKYAANPPHKIRAKRKPHPRPTNTDTGMSHTVAGSVYIMLKPFPKIKLILKRDILESAVVQEEPISVQVRVSKQQLKLNTQEQLI